jgi:hypothetical protein
MDMGDALFNTFESTKDTFDINSNHIKYKETCQNDDSCSEQKPYTVEIQTEDVVSFIPLEGSTSLDTYQIEVIEAMKEMQEGQMKDIIYAGDRNLKIFLQQGTLYIIDPDSVGFNSNMDLADEVSDKDLILANLKYMTIQQLEEQELKMI